MPVYSDDLEQYVRNLFAGEGEEYAQIRARTTAAGYPQGMIRPEEGRFLQFLTTVSGGKRALEIGTLGGYSGTWIIRGLAEGGWLLTIEREPERAEVARENFQSVGFSDRVEVLVGDAHQLLPEVSRRGPFDFIFIDAEKEGYPAYYEWALENLAKGGILAAHNALSHGAVVDPEDQRERTKALRWFNEQLASNPDYVSVIFPAGDGLAFGVRRR